MASSNVNAGGNQGGGNDDQGGYRVTERQQEILDAIRSGTTTTGDLAKQFGVTYSAISSMMRRLEDHRLVQRDDNSGGFVLAGEGDQGGGTQRNQGGNQGGQQAGGGQGGNNTSNQDNTTKIEGARQIFQQNTGQPRKSILQMFQDQLGMTLNGAATYYQRLRGEMGMTHAMATDGRSSNSRNSRGGGNQGNNRGNQGGNQGGNRGGNRGGNQVSGRGRPQGGRAQASAGRPNLPGVPGNTAGRSSGANRNQGQGGRR